MPTKAWVSGVECMQVRGHSKGPLCGDAASRKGGRDRRRSGTLDLPLHWALHVKLLSESAGRSGGALFQAARMHLSIKSSRSPHRAGRQNGRSLTTELHQALVHSHNLQEDAGRKAALTLPRQGRTTPREAKGLAKVPASGRGKRAAVQAALHGRPHVQRRHGPR